MDSHDRFIKKIEAVRCAPKLSALKNLVADLWSWSDSYGKGYKKVKELTDEIEITIAICFDEDRDLNQNELNHVDSLLANILKEFNNFIN